MGGTGYLDFLEKQVVPVRASPLGVVFDFLLVVSDWFSFALIMINNYRR